jgi:hypothetical protein
VYFLAMRFLWDLLRKGAAQRTTFKSNTSTSTGQLKILCVPASAELLNSVNKSFHLSNTEGAAHASFANLKST